jgi:BlaI family penicillinase repressor
MPQRRRSLTSLSAAQRELMEIVWNHEEITASQVREILGPTRDVARNTVRTLLERMEDKGWLRHREDGRTFYYSAAVPRETSVGQRVVEVLDQACGGSPETLMTALIDYRGLSRAELDRIRQMLNTATAASRKEVGR